MATIENHSPSFRPLDVERSLDGNCLDTEAVVLSRWMLALNDRLASATATPFGDRLLGPWNLQLRTDSALGILPDNSNPNLAAVLAIGAKRARQLRVQRQEGINLRIGIDVDCAEIAGCGPKHDADVAATSNRFQKPLLMRASRSRGSSGTSVKLRITNRGRRPKDRR